MSDLGPRPFRRRALWLLLAASVVVALPALGGGLLSYDDQGLILGTGQLDAEKGAVERGPLSFFTATYFYAYLPFYGLSYWIDGRIDGPNPVVFRVGNVLWHAATCYLVFCVLGLLLRSRAGALLGALLFAVHPLHVESVAWIAGRKELVSGFFFFLAWLFHLKQEEGRPRARLWSVVAFLVACFAKASAVVLPGVLLCAALLLPRYAGRRREASWSTAPLFAVALLPVLVHLLVGIHEGVVREGAALGDRALRGFAAWGASVRRALLPLDLSIDYPEARDPSAGALALAGILLGGALAAALALRRRAPEVAFGIAAFFVALSPFNDVFPATEVYAADRYLYLPLLGLSAIVAWAARERHEAAVAAGVASAACLVLATLGAARFESDERLWTTTIESRDASAVAWLNRGIVRAERAFTPPPDPQLLEAAVADLERGLTRAQLVEHRARANAALVQPLLRMERPADAFDRATQALALVEGSDTDDARTFRARTLYDRGLVRTALGAHAEAARDFEASAKLWPRFATFYEGGRAWMRAGRLNEALRALEAAAKHDPESPWPWLDMAHVYRASDQRAARRDALREAARRAPGEQAVVAGWVNFWLDAQSPDYLKARKELERLPEGSPLRSELGAEVDAQHALFLFRRGAREEAVAAAAAALDGGLTKQQLLYELGQIFMETGRYDDAVRCIRGATDVLEQRRAYRDATARAYALKAYQCLLGGDDAGAVLAMRQALDVRPLLIEAGAAPLRAEAEMLREDGNDDLLRLAAAAVAGDPVRARAAAERAAASGADPILVHRLQALVDAFVSYDFGAAEDHLQQVLAADPKDRWARFRLAQVWVRRGVGWIRTARQIGSAERAAEGRAFLDRAIALLGELLQEDRDFHLARLERGEAYFALRDDVGAKADYQYVREHDGSVKEAYLKEAVLHRLVYVEGGTRTNLVTAAEILNEALALDPNYFDALYELGNVHHHLYDRQEDDSLSRKVAFNRAIFWYRRAMALNPRSKEPRVEWARICVKAANEAAADPEGQSVRNAHDLLTLVEKEAPDVPDVYRARVRLNLRDDFYDKTGVPANVSFPAAEHALERLAELAPDDPELPALRSMFHRRRGWNYYVTMIKRKDPAEKERAKELAVEEWKRALEAWPEDPEHATFRDRLREIAPEYIEYDRVLAQAAVERAGRAAAESRWEDAARDFRVAVDLFPESPELRYSYGLALARSGSLDEARAELERVANGPEGARFPLALYELGSLYYVKKEEQTARIWLERYVAAMEEAGRTGEETVRQARRLLDELGK